MISNQKEKFSIRKFKTGTHSAMIGKVVLLSALTVAMASGNSVFADETTSAPAEVTTVAQAPAEQTVTGTANKASESTTEVIVKEELPVVTVDNPKVDKAVEEAIAAGVEVTKTEEVLVDSEAEATANFEGQEKRVKEATETKKEIDQMLEESQKLATEAGVELKEEEAKTYKDDNEGALKDAEAQVKALEEGRKVQEEINETLPKAIEIASKTGVKVVVEEGKKYEDLKMALDDLAQQVKLLDEAGQKQQELDSALVLAVDKADKAGIKVTYADKKVTYKDLQEAFNAMAYQIESLAKAEEVKANSNKALAKAVEEAQKAGVKVVESPEQISSSLKEIEADVATQLKLLVEATDTQHNVDNILSEAKKYATDNKVNVIHKGIKEVNAGQAIAEANKQSEAIKQVVAEVLKLRAEYENDYQSWVSDITKQVKDALAKVPSTVSGNADVKAKESQLMESLKGDSKQADKALTAYESFIKTFNSVSATDAKERTEANKKDAEVENARRKAEYEKALAKKADLDAQIKAIHDKNRAIFAEKGLTYTGNYDKDKATVDQWNKENAGEKVSSSSESGLTATPSTGYTGVSNATKATHPLAAYAIQGLYRSENTDADFNNVFKIENGKATIRVTNTSHGDVLLTFSNIQVVPGSAHTADFVALWDSGDGGIAYGVFTGAGTGAYSQGGAEGAGGYVAGAGARVGWIKSVDIDIETVESDFYEATFNDIDNLQTLDFTTLNGGTVTKGKNISGTGNSYSAGAGDVSQSSRGVLDSNGLGISYDKPTKIKLSFKHSTGHNDATSIVGGLFGQSSQKEIKVIVKEISIEKAPDETTVKNWEPVTPKSVDPTVLTPLETPEKPKEKTAEMMSLQVVADYHKVNAEVTVTPATVEVTAHDITVVVPVHEVNVATTVNPVKVRLIPKEDELPSTGEADSLMTVLSGVLMSGLGVLGIRKKEND
ncbi:MULTISPECIES: YSIRK-type signal peptide-containing protein [Streptococcus]|uniref:YSIRK-type signal peptide-containing protein n=1 Tax=Streptococcus caledonicus TaxID=2614158 RepID=A0ABW0UGM8_9STRE|nr:YSIRK-type signal peptide-containing protein [Streptococcus sp. S784/96/1]